MTLVGKQSFAVGAKLSLSGVRASRCDGWLRLSEKGARAWWGLLWFAGNVFLKKTARVSWKFTSALRPCSPCGSRCDALVGRDVGLRSRGGCLCSVAVLKRRCVKSSSVVADVLGVFAECVRMRAVQCSDVGLGGVVVLLEAARVRGKI